MYSTADRADGSHLSKAESIDMPIDNLVFKNDVATTKKLLTNSKNIPSKVLESWINQTLQDAEHLDIPHVILKPENIVPLTRYGIDRPRLSAAGVS